jgi:hypothetical protein
MLYQALTIMSPDPGKEICRAYGAIVMLGLGQLKVCLHLRGDGAKKD